MEARLCKLLDQKADELARIYSDPTLAKKNINGVAYAVDHTFVCSDLTGTVVLKKSNGQRVVIWCYWIAFQSRDGNNGEFRWLTVRYDHLFGMARLTQIMAAVEAKNFKSNIAPVEAPVVDDHAEWWSEYDKIA
jgi:hypothetical protein